MLFASVEICFLRCRKREGKIASPQGMSSEGRPSIALSLLFDFSILLVYKTLSGLAVVADCQTIF